MPRAFRSAAVLLLLFGTPASADPVAVTAGEVIFTDEPGLFSMAGRGFELHAGWFPTTLSGTFWFQRCVPGCLPGTIVDFGTTTYGFSPSFPPRGSGTIGGVTYDQLFLAGELTFTGPRVTAPFEDRGPVVAPFTFDGRLLVYAGDEATGTPVFSALLTGAGSARVFFDVGPGSPATLSDLEYAFEDPAPIPEPGTLLLLATGAAAGAARLRRLRPREPR